MVLRNPYTKHLTSSVIKAPITAGRKALRCGVAVTLRARNQPLKMVGTICPDWYFRAPQVLAHRTCGVVASPSLHTLRTQTQSRLFTTLSTNPSQKKAVGTSGWLRAKGTMGKVKVPQPKKKRV